MVMNEGEEQRTVCVVPGEQISVKEQQADWYLY